MGLMNLINDLKRVQQRMRWENRKAKREDLGLRRRAKKGSAKRESKGAFGTPGFRKLWDLRPALKPAAMRELAKARKLAGYV